MKDPNFIVRIPEPCHEDWNKMKPEEKGRFCNSCSKTVVDFSNKTDYEIKTILEEDKSGQMCGHFKKSQLDRPLNYKLDLKNLPGNITTTKAFAIALFFVFGSLLFSCTNEKDQNLNIIGAIPEPPKTEEPITLGGAIAFNEIPQVTEVDGGDLDQVEVSVYAEPLIDSGEYTLTGGVGYHTEDPIKDSVVEPAVVDDTVYKESMMDGLIVSDYYEDPTPSDSVSEKNRTIHIGDNVISKSTDLSIYPNPTSGEFTIKYDVTKRADIKIDVYDMKGALVKPIIDQASHHSGKYQIPVSLNEIPPGVYIVNLINGDRRFTEKVIIGK